MTKHWKLEDAETSFSQLVRDAEREPQVITQQDKAAVYVVGAAQFEQLSGRGRMVSEILRRAPIDDDFEPELLQGTDWAIDL